MLDVLKQELADAICLLKQHDFNFLNQGSLSVCDRANSLLVTHPVPCPVAPLPEQMLITDTSGKTVEGEGDPSATLSAHLELFRAFPTIGAVVHSHGLYTTAWAQAGRDIPVYGTGHLEHFAEAIPCTRAITADDITDGYNSAIGNCVVEMFQKKSLDPETLPAALIFQHGAYVWGPDAKEAVRRCIALEQTAHLAWLTENINPSIVDTRVPIIPRTDDL